MPVRPTTPTKQEIKKVYDYDDLVVHLREHIDEEYGGVAKFLESKDFDDVGLFNTTKKDKSKMFTYLSLPAEGNKTRVKSFPVLAALYEKLLGITLESKIEVVRTQKIYSLDKIPLTRK